MTNIIKNSIIHIYLSLRNNVKIKSGAVLNLRNRFEGKNVICENVIFRNSYLGFASYIGPGSEFFATKIGKYTCIGPNVKLITGSHPSHTFVSIHPCFYSLRKQSGFTFVENDLFQEFKFIEGSKNLLEIGNDVWIGADVRILQGVKIGDGAIIAAGSIVSKDISPYSICGGNPCKLIRKRFEEAQIEQLLNQKWWDLPFSQIKRFSHLFVNIEDFLKNKDELFDDNEIHTKNFVK